MASCEGEVKLLGTWMSPFAKRVEWVLKLKGIEFEYVEENLKDKSPSLLKYNPIHKRVPVLVHSGNPVVESLLIIEYVDDTWQENYPILPKEPYARAQARFWAKFIEEKFTETVREILFLDSQTKEAKAEEAKKALDELERVLAKMGTKFFGGDTIGLVDIALGWITIWLNVVEEVACVKVFDAERFPELSKWSEGFQELPVIKDSFPPRDKSLVYYHEIRQYCLALSAAKN